GLFQKRRSHHFFQLLVELVQIAGAAGFGILDRESTRAECDRVAVMENLLGDRRAVDRGAVGAVEIADDPVAFLEGQFAVLAGKRREGEADIARLAASKDERGAQERDVVAAALWDQFAVWLSVHERFRWT